jgi:hypothetical protein
MTIHYSRGISELCHGYSVVRPVDVEARLAEFEDTPRRCRVCGAMGHQYRVGHPGAGKTPCEWEATAE